MKIDNAGLEFIEQLEGYRSKPYKDTKGIWTIGIGSTMIDGKPVTANTPAITREKALELLGSYIDKICAPRLSGLNLNQNQYNALCSFVYNIGAAGFDSSSAFRLVREGKYTLVPDAMMLWIKPAVLIGRRTKEANLFRK